MTDRLVVRYLPDEDKGLSDYERFLEILKAMASNGGDSRCLCTACIAYWALHHLEKT